MAKDGGVFSLSLNQISGTLLHRPCSWGISGLPTVGGNTESIEN